MADREKPQFREHTPPGRLSRPRDDRLMAGVCAGIAHYFGWSPTRVRIVYSVVTVLSAAFPGIAVYAVLWLLMPDEPRGARSFHVR